MRDEPPPVRTCFDIKKSLLQRAFSGESRHTPSEMILLIQWVLSRARDVPAGHRKELDVIREIEREQEQLRALLQEMGISEADLGPESRALRCLNLEERRRGLEGNWAPHGHLRRLLTEPAPGDSLN